MFILQYIKTMSAGVKLFLTGKCTWVELKAFFIVVNYAYYVYLAYNYGYVIGPVYDAVHAALQSSIWLHIWIINPLSCLPYAR